MYKANKKYKISYYTTDGEVKYTEITPEEDMNRPQMVMKMKEQDENFLRLIEGKGDKGMNPLDEKIKPWYEKAYPEEYTLPDLNPNVTFREVYENPSEICKMTGVYDSVVREVIFDETSRRAGVDYDDLYYRWLNDIKIDSHEDRNLTESTEKEYKTLADIIEDGRACDVYDNTIDAGVYVEYDPESNDYFDQCLSSFCKQVNIISYDEESAECIADIRKVFADNFDLFDQIFDIEGEDKEDEINNMVEEIYPGLMSGAATDTTYETIYKAMSEGHTGAEVEAQQEPVETTEIDDNNEPIEESTTEKVEEEVDNKKDISTDRKREIIAELFDWIDYHELDGLKELDVTEETLDNISIGNIEGIDLDSIINNGIACVLDHVSGDEDTKKAFIDVIGLTKNECEKLGLNFNGYDIVEESKLVEDESEEEVNNEETESNIEEIPDNEKSTDNIEISNNEDESEENKELEDMTEFQTEAEEVIENLDNPTEEEKLGIKSIGDTTNVLIADEESAINGYNDFLNAAKEVLIPSLYPILEKEVLEIIKDEEDHIAKLENIRSIFHLEDIPLDENLKLNEANSNREEL